MRKFFTAAVLLGFTLTAFSASPSEASIHEMFRVTKVEAMLDSMWAQMETGIKQTIAIKQQNKNFTADDQKVLDAFTSKYVEVMRSEMSLMKLAPMYVQVYQETFTQEDIDGILAFYKSPAGKAMVDKMPVMVQKMMTMLPKRIAPMMQKMDAALEQTMADLKARKQK